MKKELEHKPQHEGIFYKAFVAVGLYRLAAEAVALQKPIDTGLTEVAAVDELLQAATMTSERTKKRLAVKIRRTAEKGYSSSSRTFEYPLRTHTSSDPKLAAYHEAAVDMQAEANKIGEQIKDIQSGDLTPWKK